MTVLSLIYAPDPIFKKKAEAVTTVDDTTRKLVADLFDTLEHEKAVGVAAPMVGVLKRIAVVDLHEDNVSNPHCFINPQITWKSDEMQSFEEGSICFVGISALISRPKAIRLTYLNEQGNHRELEAEGFLAHVIQHELDYLDGITFPDHLSKMKRDMLIKKMLKTLKHYPPHVHSEHCNH